MKRCSSYARSIFRGRKLGCDAALKEKTENVNDSKDLKKKVFLFHEFIKVRISYSDQKFTLMK
jgi:hypothetical protein